MACYLVKQRVTLLVTYSSRFHSVSVTLLMCTVQQNSSLYARRVLFCRKPIGSCNSSLFQVTSVPRYKWNGAGL